jgi:hypothetical protein
MVVKKPKQLHLDVTEPNLDGMFYIMHPSKKDTVIGEVAKSEFMKHPEKFMTEEIVAVKRTGWRKKKTTKKSKAKRTKKDCGCK